MAQTAATKKRLTKAAAITLTIGIGLATVVALFVLIADGQAWVAAILFVFITAATIGLTIAANSMRR